MPYQADLVSIITPAYNSEKFIRATMDSALAQTYKKWEMLIAVDQGTVDSTIDIVNEYSAKDSRIKLIHIKNARGVSLARNTAIAASSGQYIAFLDSDDLWLPEKLERQLKFMKETGAAFSCHGYRRLSEDGKEVGHYIPVKAKVNYNQAIYNNTIGCLTVVADRLKTGEFKLVEGRHEDYILWLDILKRNVDCYGLNEDLGRYRYVANARSRMIYSALVIRWNIYRQLEHLGFFHSLSAIISYILTALLKRKQF